MIRHGTAPFLECSSRGDRRFSAYYARIRSRGGRSVEEIYQAAKIFHGEDLGGCHLTVTGLTPQEARGRSADNQSELSTLYAQLWDEYIAENPELISVLQATSGLSDVFGQPGRNCQATELWRIRNHSLTERIGP